VSFIIAYHVCHYTTALLVVIIRGLIDGEQKNRKENMLPEPADLKMH